MTELLVRETGWSKARLIAQRTGTKPEACRAIAFARDKTLPALAAYFQGDGNGMALVTKSFRLTGRRFRPRSGRRSGTEAVIKAAEEATKPVI